MERLPWEGRHSLRICFLVPKNPLKNPRKLPKGPSESEATVHCKSMRQNRPRLCLVQWEEDTAGNLDLLSVGTPSGWQDAVALIPTSLWTEAGQGVCHSANEEVGQVSEGQTRGTCGWQLHTPEPALRDQRNGFGGGWGLEGQFHKDSNNTEQSSCEIAMLHPLFTQPEGARPGHYEIPSLHHWGPRWRRWRCKQSLRCCWWCWSFLYSRLHEAVDEKKRKSCC